MLLTEVQTVDVFDSSNPDHQKMMADIDFFTASPNTTLKPETVAFLTQRSAQQRGTIELLRVLFTDDTSQLAKMLNVLSFQPGNQGMHESTRPTSWTTDSNTICGMVASDEIDHRYAVVVKAVIDRRSVLLNTSELSANDLKHIYLFDQKEVIVAAGRYPIVIVKAVDREAM